LETIWRNKNKKMGKISNLDVLDKIWKKQKDFTTLVNGVPKTQEEKELLTKEFLLHLNVEAIEILQELNWKMHREKTYNQYNPIKISNIREECIDVFKYLLSIMQFWNMTPEKFIEEFYRKSDLVELRYKQEKQLKLITDKNVVGIDLDGCIANYPQSYYDFIFKKIGKKIEDDGSYKIYDNVAKALGERKAKLLKHEYRESGQKKFVSCINEPDKITSKLKKLGYKIIILSSRPCKEYPRIAEDTMFWLKNNNIKYDALFFDENKDEKIIQKFPKLNFMIEDHGDNALKIAKRGYKVFLVDKPYNRGIKHNNVIRVVTLKEIFKYVK